ncbi:type II toxin-antitoxin system RelE/ParE family toxin [Caviibacterium pharyngocola]|nr:type II toxin-antitoxin system RelE/ParE family toxin [Caviibacterium pharyngocola]
MPNAPKQVVLTQKAKRDIQEIIRNVVDYTSHYSSGETLANELKHKILMLGFIPKSGRNGIVEGTRELFCRSYRIVYKETELQVRILTVIHSRRNYP